LIASKFGVASYEAQGAFLQHGPLSFFGKDFGTTDIHQQSISVSADLLA